MKDGMKILRTGTVAPNLFSQTALLGVATFKFSEVFSTYGYKNCQIELVKIHFSMSTTLGNYILWAKYSK